MADAILGADAPARKLTSSDIPHTRSVMALEGLVADPHLDLGSQIAILAAIDETGSASLGDLMALLPDHPSPGQAIIALIREGALVVTSSGLIDAHSQVARRVNPPLRQKAASISEGPKKGVQHLKVVAPEPDIFFASGIDRTYFVREPRLRQKGIYLALYGSAVYVGRSGDTACRIAWGAHLRRNGLALATRISLFLFYAAAREARPRKEPSCPILPIRPSSSMTTSSTLLRRLTRPRPSPCGRPWSAPSFGGGQRQCARLCALTLFRSFRSSRRRLPGRAPSVRKFSAAILR